MTFYLGHFTFSINQDAEMNKVFFLGAVSKIRSQGICGSCYAYAVTSAMESAYYLKVDINQSNCRP